MADRISHVVRFDREGRLLSEQQLSISQEDLRPDFTLDAAFARRLADDYFDTVRRSTFGLFRSTSDNDRRLITMAALGNMLIFDRQRIEANQRAAKIIWHIAGGKMLARDIADGGRFIVGAEWNQSGTQLTLCVRVEDYTTRLVGLFGRRLGKFIYQFTQGLSHQNIALHFLRAQALALTVQKP